MIIAGHSTGPDTGRYSAGDGATTRQPDPVAQAMQDAVALEIWDDEGGAAVRRTSMPKRSSAAATSRDAVPHAFFTGAVASSPALARPPKN